MGEQHVKDNEPSFFRFPGTVGLLMSDQKRLELHYRVWTTSHCLIICQAQWTLDICRAEKKLSLSLHLAARCLPFSLRYILHDDLIQLSILHTAVAVAVQLFRLIAAFGDYGIHKRGKEGGKGGMSK